jgi:hypothetical protein
MLLQLSLKLLSFEQKLLHQVQNDTITHVARSVAISNVVSVNLVRTNLKSQTNVRRNIRRNISTTVITTIVI